MDTTARNTDFKTDRTRPAISHIGTTQNSDFNSDTIQNTIYEETTTRNPPTHVRTTTSYKNTDDSISMDDAWKWAKNEESWIHQMESLERRLMETTKRNTDLTAQVGAQSGKSPG
jgi:hypothetical protein